MRRDDGVGKARLGNRDVHGTQVEHAKRDVKPIESALTTGRGNRQVAGAGSGALRNGSVQNQTRSSQVVQRAERQISPWPVHLGLPRSPQRGASGKNAAEELPAGLSPQLHRHSSAWKHGSPTEPLERTGRRIVRGT